MICHASTRSSRASAALAPAQPAVAPAQALHQRANDPYAGVRFVPAQGKLTASRQRDMSCLFLSTGTFLPSKHDGLRRFRVSPDWSLNSVSILSNQAHWYVLSSSSFRINAKTHRFKKSALPHIAPTGSLCIKAGPTNRDQSLVTQSGIFECSSTPVYSRQEVWATIDVQVVNKYAIYGITQCDE